MKDFYVKHCFYIIIWLITGYQGTAQTGPGGVGTTDGSSSLKLWLRADKGVFTDAGTAAAANGQKVQQWSDQSGNILHATQSVESYKPTFKSAFYNGQPSLGFATNQLGVLFNISPANTPSFTVFAVASHTAPAFTVSKLFGHDDGGYDRTIGFDHRGGKRFAYFTGTSVGSFSNIPQANTPFIMTANYTTSTFSGWVNGVQEVNGALVSNAAGAASFGIGNLTSNTVSHNNEFWNGDIAEFILFNRSVTKAERLLIENYLAAKYGTMLDASSDLYTMDNGGYDFDVAGIGRADDGSAINAAKGTGLVSFTGTLSAAPVGVNSFLFLGHNNGSLLGLGSDVPTGLLLRMGREWRVSETAEVGAIDLSFDLSGQPVADAADLRLLIDTDNDGTYHDETVAGGGVIDGAVKSGNTYTFNNINLSDGARFTLGSTSATTLPLTLLSFEVVKQGHANQLTWRTASEQHTAYFEVENSVDAKNFATIGRVAAAGNSSSMASYSFIENSPAASVFYRLKMVDKDGKYTYSKIVNGSGEQLTQLHIRIAPNPVTGKAIIKGLSGQPSLIKLVTMKGEVILQDRSSQTVYELDLSAQPAGTYFIQVITDNKTWTERIIKS